MKCKKILAMLLALALMLSAAACTKNDESGSSSSSGSGTTNQIEVGIYQYKTNAGDALIKAAKTFTDANPDIKITVTSMGEGEDYRTALAGIYSATPAPVIFNIQSPQDLADWDGRLEDLTAEPWVENAVEGSLLPVTANDKIYGMPVAIEGYGFVYNRAIFETAGIDTSTLDTYKDIESAMKMLKTKIDTGELKEKYPLLEAVTEIPAKETWSTGIHTLNLALVGEFAGASEAYNAASLKLENSEALRELYDLQATYSKYASDRGKLNEVDYTTQIAGGLATERIAMVQQGNWVYNEVAAVNKDVARNLDMLPLPLNGVIEDSISVGVPMYWCVNKASTEPEKAAAKKFLSWLYQSEEGKRIVIDELGFIPPFTNYDELEPADPLSKAVKRYAEDSKTIPWVFTGFPHAWGQEVFGVNIQRYFSGEMTWDEIVKDAKFKWEEARKGMAEAIAPDGSSSVSPSASSPTEAANSVSTAS